MKKLSIGQRKSLAEFFTNAAVAWLSAGVIAPIFAGRTLANIIGAVVWAIMFTIWFIAISLFLTRGVRL